MTARKIFSRDELSHVVVNLRQIKNENEYNVGTGIFICHNNKLFLVTASHVAIYMKLTGEYVLRGPGDKPQTLNINHLINGFNAESIPWKHHKTADIAVLDLNPSAEVINQYFTGRFLLSDV